MVIPTAAAFGVEMDNLSTAYAILTANGVQTAQSTTYLKSMMSELANTGSEVSKTLLEETGQSFSQLMENGYSLGDVMQVLGDSVDGNTTAFMNLWGSMEAGSGAVSLYNSGAEKYASVLDQMQRSAGATSTAYGIMTDTTEFSSQRMENSLNNLKIAFGDDLNPVVRSVQHGVADVADSFTDLVKKHPAITTTLTGITTGFGLVTAGVAAYTAAVNLGNMAMAAFGVTSAAALLPLAGVAVAIAAVTTVAIAYGQKMAEIADVEDNLLDSSQKMSDELDSLYDQYDRVVEASGRTSTEAYALQHQIDELSTSFSQNKMTIGDLSAEIERLSTSIEDTYRTYEDAVTANGQLEYSSMALVQQLTSLATKTNHTDSELLVMRGIVDSLNSSYQDLGLTLDDTTGKLNLSVDDMYSVISHAADEANRQAATDGMIKTLQSFADIQEEAELAQSEVDEALQKYKDLEAKWKEEDPIESALSGDVYSDVGLAFAEASIEYTRLKAESDAANAAYDNSIRSLEEYCETLGFSTEQTEEFIKMTKESSYELDTLVDSLSKVEDATLSVVDLSENAASTALSSVQKELETLATKYDEAYTAAYNSIDGQIGLFEKMKTKSEITVSDMQNAMESQIEYINRYTENLQKAQEYGLDEGLISKLSDGSAESAGQIDAIIGKIEKLGGTTEDAQSFVTSFNSSFEQVTTAKDTFAETVGTMESDFAAGMDKIHGDLNEAIVKMDMSDEAKEAAGNMMDAYIDTIRSKTSEVNSALSALSFMNTSVIGSGVKIDGAYTGAYATGTMDAAPGLALVGEEGPELVRFGGGEVVYTADETADILSGGLEGREDGDFYVAPMSESDSAGDQPGGPDETVHIIKIEGGSDIVVKGSADKEGIVQILAENLKGVLMELVQTEIMEEGEGAYEF